MLDPFLYVFVITRARQINVEQLMFESHLKIFISITDMHTNLLFITINLRFLMVIKTCEKYGFIAEIYQRNICAQIYHSSQLWA